MFALQEFFRDAYSLIYSQLTPFERVYRSFTNAIFTDGSTVKGISFIECIAQGEVLQFVMVNVCIIYEGGTPVVRSNITPVAVPKLSLRRSSVDVIKIEVIKNPHSHQEYLLFLKICMVNSTKTYLVGGFQYDLEELLEGEAITLGVHQISKDRLCKVQWLPHINQKDVPCIVTVSPQELRYFHLQDPYKSRQILKYYLLPECQIETEQIEVVDSAFFSVYRPFYLNVLVLLKKNGDLYFGIPAVSESSPDFTAFRRFYSAYCHQDNSEKDDFRLLHKEYGHIKQKRVYINLKIIDLEKRLPGLSLLILFSLKEVVNEYRIQLFFLSLDQSAFLLTPIVSIIKKSQKPGEFVFEDQGDRVYFRIEKEIWVLDLEGLVRLHMQGKYNGDKVVQSIKMEKVISFAHLKSLRLAVIAQGYLFMLRMKQEKILFQIHEIGPFPTNKKEEDISLLMVKLKSELQKIELTAPAIAESPNEFNFVQLEDTDVEILQKYEEYVQNTVIELQQAMLEQSILLKSQSKELIKVVNKFTDKVNPKRQRLAVLMQKVHHNTSTLEDLFRERLQEIEGDQGSEKYQILMEKVMHITENKVELQQQDRDFFTATAETQRQNAQHISKSITRMSAKLDSLLRSLAQESDS